MQNYIYWATDETESIEHFGILGQKWGVRRYQNEDGTLTEAGKHHYGIAKYERKGGYRVNKRLGQLEEAAEKYNKAEIEYQNNKNRETSAARQKARSEYTHVKQLMKKANMADEGAELRSKGVTISGGAKGAEVFSGAVGTAGILTTVAAGKLLNSGIDKVTLGTDTNKININMATVAGIGAILGGSAGALNIGLNAIRRGRDNKLRAYYDYKIKEK